MLCIPNFNYTYWYYFICMSQKMVCHGQHTYVYSLVLLQVLSRESKGGANMKRLAQEITRCAQQRYAYNLHSYFIGYRHACLKFGVITSFHVCSSLWVKDCFYNRTNHNLRSLELHSNCCRKVIDWVWCSRNFDLLMSEEIKQIRNSGPRHFFVALENLGSNLWGKEHALMQGHWTY